MTESVRKTRILLLSLLIVLGCLPAAAQRQLERLDRGVVAMRTGVSTVYVGWRMLGTDPDNTAFNVYRVSNGVTNLIAGAVLNSCNVVDGGANLSQANTYFIRGIVGGVVLEPSSGYTLLANPPTQQFLQVPLSRPPGGTTPSGEAFTYQANDASVGDVDADGEYEIFLRWEPSNAKDNSQGGFTGHTLLDCYKLNGTLLWRIDLGPNIRAGAHYTQFMVYDFDGDGRAELMCRTAPGSRDGSGNYVGSVAKWQNANGARPSFNNTDDYRYSNPNGGADGYVLAGPEFLTVFRGATGEELASAGYYPKRDPENNNDNPSASRLNQVWGDSYGNRVDRFLAGVAYLDGRQPSAIFCRGYYTRAVIAAWDWRDGRLSRRWVFDSNTGPAANRAYRGQGAHSLTVGDVDGDGRDEIVYGAASIDDNGQGLYATGLGHGDALHLSDMNPLRPGLEIWMVHESPASYGPYGGDFRDARTGAVLFGVDGQNTDIGRGIAMDIDPRHPGYEAWMSRGGLMSSQGTQISGSRPGQMNFAIWWDTDLTRELLDGTTISKWNWNSSSTSSLLSPGGMASVNGTKSNPCLSADLFGDWREEVIWRTSDNTALRIYTATTLSTNRLYTLMHDPQYRCAIAWQNTGYNQPPHPGFFLGAGMAPAPRAPISAAARVWQGGQAGNVWDESSLNWRTNGVWSTNTPAIAFSGESVLFDLLGAAHGAVTLNDAVEPADVTVFSASDYTFSGSGSIAGSGGLLKAGQGRLTINTINTFTGPTIVSGGSFLLNGAVVSPVLVERRGTPEGQAMAGGSGVFGGGLNIQPGCTMIVGAGTNSAGTLTVSNYLVLAGVSNLFDLSSGLNGPNDRVDVIGDLALSGTNLIVVRLTDGFLAGGVYPLITYTGTLSGGLNNLRLVGEFIQDVVLTNLAGQIALVATVPEAPPSAPAQLQAVAINATQIGLAWRHVDEEVNAFLIERSAGNSAGFAPMISVPGNVTNYVDSGLLPNVTYYYRVQATNLAGFSEFSNIDSATTSATPPSLTWRGDGSQNVWDVLGAANWFDGTTLTMFTHGALVTFDNSGSNSPNVNLSQVVQPGALVFSSSSRNFTIGGVGRIAGPTSLVKAGSSTVSISTTNTYTGGTILYNGTLAITGSGVGAYTPNNYVLGSGPVTLRGGRLNLYGFGLNDNSSGFGLFTNRIIVEPGYSGTVAAGPRQTLGSTVTGSGTLNLFVDYVRGEVAGDWTGFAGVLNVIPTTGTPPGGTFDDFRVSTASGFPGARLNLAPNIYMYSRAAVGSVIPIGEFNSSAGAIVSAGIGSGLGAHNSVTWRAGGLNTHSTNHALIQGSTSLIKEGTGSWTLTGPNTYSGTTTVNGGTLTVHGDQSGATGTLTVMPGAAVSGRGVIGGLTTVNGTLAPGEGIGTLRFNSGLNLGSGSITLIDVQRSPLTNDVVAVAGTTVLGGTLRVVNAGPELLEAGDRFQVVRASAIVGTFSDYDLPGLEAGLEWNTSRVAHDGTLWVVRNTPPAVTELTRKNSTLVIRGSGGTPDWEFIVLTTTNLATAIEWKAVATNAFDSSGAFSITNDWGHEEQRFFQLRLR